MRGLSLRQAFDEQVARPMSAGELLGSLPPRPRLYGLDLLCSSLSAKSIETAGASAY